MNNNGLAPDGDLFTSLCGAFLAALITLSVQWCFSEIGWGYVGWVALFGLVVGWCR